MSERKEPDGLWPVCETCRFWKPCKLEMPDRLVGECRRYPPVVGRDDGQWSQIRPEMCVYDWCGEWKPKEPPSGVTCRWNDE